MTHLKTLGFTLIELVIVIVLLGILTATALPRFLDLSTDAKRAANLQVVGALNAALANYTLQAQLPLNAQSPIQPTIDVLSPKYGILRTIDVKLDTPDGTKGTLLFFGAFPTGGSKTKLVGGAFLVPKDPTTKQLLSEGATPSSTSAAQAEDGSSGADDNAIFRNLNQLSASTCLRIFNILLNNGSIRCTTTGGPSPAPPGGAVLGRAVANSPFPYQAFYTNGTPGALINPPSGTFTTSTAGSTVPNAGSCLWVRTDSINSYPVFYIYYNVYDSKFIAIEAES